MRCTWLGWLAYHLARYGVARVYSQQCGYVLTDVEAARNSMRAMFKSLKTSELDEQGHKGRWANIRFTIIHNAVRLTCITVRTS